MSAAAILAEARARLAAAFPGWTDESDRDHPTPAAALPAFRASLSLSGGERVAMGSASSLRDGELLVVLRTVTGPGDDARAILWGHEATARAAIMAAPADLGGAAWSILPGSAEPDTDTAKERIGTLDLGFDVQLLT
ncbi:hypothetical protein [Poseidonocella sp. HB161398]|uniref:hypothetical protein n=1 Tax=Poseidonocella sp. HB161398 TaxID=2320855 RepID=UPI0011089FC0|nr:hypothetical protein [Poseidonocella sp. HB161398]